MKRTEIGNGERHNRGLLLRTMSMTPAIERFFASLSSRTNVDADGPMPYLANHSLFETRASTMINFVEKSSDGLMALRHLTPNCDAPEGNLKGNGKIFSYSMRRDPFEQLQRFEALPTASQRQARNMPIYRIVPTGAIANTQQQLQLPLDELVRLMRETRQFYAVADKLNDTHCQKLFGVGRECLGFNSDRRLTQMTAVDAVSNSSTSTPLLTLENLFAALHGKSRRGVEAFAMKMTVTVSDDHKVFFRNDWVRAGASINLKQERSQLTCSRPGVNHEYGVFQGEPKHDFHDYVTFNQLSSAADLEHFRNYLCYMFWLDFCVFEEMRIEVPSIPDIGCGNFAPENRRTQIRRATAEALLFVLENFPFREVKAVLVTAFDQSYETFAAVLNQYRGAVPLAVVDRDMMTVQLLGDKANVRTCLVNAADSHKIPGGKR
jgi:hypothetical protein